MKHKARLHACLHFDYSLHFLGNSTSIFNRWM